ncbi:MAG: hypothetical protein LBH43_21745 [Treponema sp.]|jgi:hypothetical protein|nr:hypothetical protein [Treponema sp.]
MGRGKINYNDKERSFKRITGVEIKTFKEMKEVLEKKYGKIHKRGGSPQKMPAGGKLYTALKYLREYRAMEHIGVAVTASEKAQYANQYNGLKTP